MGSQAQLVGLPAGECVHWYMPLAHFPDVGHPEATQVCTPATATTSQTGLVFGCSAQMPNPAKCADVGAVPSRASVC